MADTCGGALARDYACLLVETLCVLARTLYLCAVGAVKACLPAGVLPRKSVAGEIILITGAGSGLGRLLAVRFGRLGARLVLWDVDEAGNERTAELVRLEGACAYTYAVNVTDRENVYDAARRVRSEVGQVYMLVNNAGVVGAGPLLGIADAAVERTMGVNCMAHFWTLKAFLPAMVESGRGHLVTVASAAGLVGCNNLAEYSASKAAAVALAEAVGMEQHHAGRARTVGTTIVCPFYMDTGMFEGASTRFPLLMPILRPDYVCERVVDAVLSGQQTLFMPRIVYVLLFLKGVLPVDAAFALADFFGVTRSMEEFKGRAGKKAW